MKIYLTPFCDYSMIREPSIWLQLDLVNVNASRSLSLNSENVHDQDMNGEIFTSIIFSKSSFKLTERHCKPLDRSTQFSNPSFSPLIGFLGRLQFNVCFNLFTIEIWDSTSTEWKLEFSEASKESTVPLVVKSWAANKHTQHASIHASHYLEG